MKFILSTLIALISSYAQATEMTPLIRGLERTLGVSLSTTNQRVRGINCVVDVRLEFVNEIETPYVRVGVFSPELFSITNSIFSPSQSEKCQVREATGTSVSVYCPGLYCESAGCIEEETRISVSPSLIQLQSLSCHLQ